MVLRYPCTKQQANKRSLRTYSGLQKMIRTVYPCITNWILSKSRIYIVWIFWFRMSIMETAPSKCSMTTVESCTSPSTGMMTAISFQGLVALPRSVHYSFDMWLLLFLSNCIKCKLDIVTVIREKIINPFPDCLWICPKFILLWVVRQIYP